MTNKQEPKVIGLGWFGKNELLKRSVCEVLLPLSFDRFGHPIVDGLYDLRMGAFDKNQQCGTCGLYDLSCPGHVGHIRLSAPVVNPLMYDLLLLLLRSMCFNCLCFKMTDFERTSLYIELKALKNRIVLDDVGAFVRNRTMDEIEESLSNIGKSMTIDDSIKAYEEGNNSNIKNIPDYNSNNTNNSKLEEMQFKVVDGFLRKYAKKTKCPRCGIRSSRIIKTGVMRVLLEGKRSDGIAGPNKRRIVSYDVKGTNRDYFNPAEMMDLIAALYTNESALLTEFFNGGNHEMFFIEIIPVIPNRFRPARFVDDAVYESPVNTQLARIMEVSCALEADTKYWGDLQEYVYLYFDASRSKVSPKIGCKQILERKEGLFRSNIMGKRVNYSARSVISPDSSLHTGEVGIPLVFARTLTFPEKVTAFNVERLREAVANGTTYPGCTFVECDGVLTNMARISDGKRLAIARQLSSGRKVVWRHMVDGDHVLLNRQPTLHCAGLMGHTVRVLREGSTIRIHYVNCKSYNADFDGDEMNIHFPQSFPAMAECKLLAHNNQNYIVQATGMPIRGLEQDHVVGAARLTFKDSFFIKDEYFQLVAGGTGGVSRAIRGACVRKTVKPCIISPCVLYSGKQVVSSVFLTMGITIDYSTKSKLTFVVKDNEFVNNYSSNRYNKNNEFLENTFRVRRGVVLSGVLDKSTIGATVKSFVHVCGETYGYRFCNDVLAAVSATVNAYLLLRGFTVRFDDLLMDAEFDEKRACIFKKSNDEAIKMQMDDHTLFRDETFHFDDAEVAHLDACMRGFMNQTMSKCVNGLESGLLKKMPNNNMANIIMSGAKGSIVNFSQITCALGQQELENRRVPFMESGKTLPCFACHEKCPAAGGNIFERFLTGLTPASFFFYCMAGREGLIDTAVKTANSGYLQRSLVKHLEGVRIEYDGTVRNGRNVIQYRYGDDGRDCFFNLNLNTLEKDFKENKSFNQDVIDSSENDIINTIDYKKHEDAKRSRLVDPGKSVGIIAAQSIGEPSTQMTLNTFHLAGVGGKNVTLGIPRLREILMVASKKIKTPVIFGKIREDCLYSLNYVVEVFKRYTLHECLDAIKVTEQVIDVNGEYVKKVAISFTIAHMIELCVKAINKKFLALLRKEIKKKSSTVSIAECTNEFQSCNTETGNDDQTLGNDTDASDDVSEDADDIIVPEDNGKDEDNGSGKEKDEDNLSSKHKDDEDDNEDSSSVKDNNDEKSSENDKDVINSNAFNTFNSDNIYTIEVLFPVDFNVFLLPSVEAVTDKIIVKEIPGFAGASVDGERIIMEGSDFFALNNTYFGINIASLIDWNETYSNDIFAVYSVFGIEAARTCIVEEIRGVFDVYGIKVNIRHLYLIADYMTRNGMFSPFNRGAFTMDDSFIQKMSFESCFSNLKRSAIYHQHEVVTNPSTCILLGNRIAQGTGSFDLLYNLGNTINE